MLTAGSAVRDFPFYDGRPVGLTGRQWWTVLAGVALGLAVLLFLPVPGPPVVGTWVRAVLFAGIPLVVYARAVPGHWRAIFHRVGLLDVALMVLFALLNVAVALVLAYLLAPVADFSANPRADSLADMPAGEVVATFLAMVPQLFGEELFSVLPFLALLAWLRRAHSRGTALVVSSAVTVVLFGAIHLPTYDWNLVQCFVVIGAARLILLTAYLVTKNLWVDVGAHVLNDWIMFGLVL